MEVVPKEEVVVEVTAEDMVRVSDSSVTLLL